MCLWCVHEYICGCICVIVHECVCVVYSVYVCGVYMSLCVGGGTRLMENNLFIFLPYSMRQSLSVKASAHQYGWSSWAGCSGTLPLPLLGLQLQVICCTFRPFI